MKTLILITLLLCSCGNPVNHLTYRQDNGCVPQAIICKKALSKKKVWSRVVLYYYNNMGHAICVFEYGGKLWTYDHEGSFTIKADKNDPLAIAKQADLRRGKHKEVKRAKFLD